MPDEQMRSLQDLPDFNMAKETVDRTSPAREQELGQGTDIEEKQLVMNKKLKVNPRPRMKQEITDTIGMKYPRQGPG
jgi:hypothetical protein